MARKVTAINALKAERKGFRHKFGEAREGLPPAENGWHYIPEFRFYAYEWWFNDNTNRFAVSDIEGTSWAMLINKPLHDWLLTKICDLDAYRREQEMVLSEIQSQRTGNPERPSAVIRAEHGFPSP